MQFVDFLKTLADLELVALQLEARQFNDADTLKLILDELGSRTLKWIQAPDEACPICEETKDKLYGWKEDK